MGEQESHLQGMSNSDMDQFNLYWGSEPDKLREAIRMTMEAQEMDLPIEDLADRLAARKLIIPELGLEPVNALVHGFLKNPQGWDALLDGQEFG